MTTDPREFFSEYREGLRAIKEEAVSTIEGFNHFYGKVMNEGVLSLKVKELIALAVGIAVHCENCIMIHTRGAKKEWSHPGRDFRSSQCRSSDGRRTSFYFSPSGP